MKHAFCAGEFVKSPADTGYITSAAIIIRLQSGLIKLNALELWDNTVILEMIHKL